MPLVKDTDLASGKLRGRTGSRAMRAFGGYFVTYNGGTASSPTYGDNPAGVGTVVNLGVPAATLGACAEYSDTFVGSSSVGVVVQRKSDSPAFDYTVDGVPGRIDAAQALMNGIFAGGLNDSYAVIPLADGLDPDQSHSVSVFLNEDAGAGAKTLRLYAWAIDETAGSGTKPVPTGFLNASGTSLPSAFAQIPIVGTTKRISFFNTDTIAHDVTITRPDNATTWKVIRIPPNDDYELSLHAGLTLAGSFWKCDTASKVTGWVEVG